jgi:hypothetical protein
MRRYSVVVASLVALGALVGCDGDGGRVARDPARDAATNSYPSASPPTETDGRPPAHQVRKPRGDTEGGAAFADWVVSTDPERRYIRDAFVRDERVLGVIVASTMTRLEVDSALHSLLDTMQKTFPGRVEAIAYYESGDQLQRLVWNAERRQIERPKGDRERIPTGR